MVIAYASRSVHLSQRRYCTTRREMLAAVAMCTHFQSYLQGAQFTLRTDHSSFRWLQKFCNGNGMLARWHMLLGQFAVTFEYRPGAQHANADGMSRQCGQCMRPGCPESSPDSRVDDVGSTSVLLDQPFASSEMGDSMDADLLPELSGETWVAVTLSDELTADLPLAGSDLDLIVAWRQDATLTTVREWVQSGAAPAWSECSGLSPELRCWRLQIGNLSVDTEGRLWRRRAPLARSSQLVVPFREHQDMIRQFLDSLFAGHLGVSRMASRLRDRVYWLGLRQDVRTYLASCAVFWPGSLLANGGPLWDMSTWATNGIGWLWIFSTCQLQPRKATDTSWLWWTVFLDGRKLARCLIRWLWLWLMLSFSILCAGSVWRL